MYMQYMLARIAHNVTKVAVTHTAAMLHRALLHISDCCVCLGCSVRRPMQEMLTRMSPRQRLAISMGKPMPKFRPRVELDKPVDPKNREELAEYKGIIQQALMHACL